MSIGISLVSIMFGAVASSACAMTEPGTAAQRCQIVSGEKLLDPAGGAAALCEAVDRAAAARRLDQGFTVAVRVEPRSLFSAAVTLANGRKLPAMQMAEMDRLITKDTLDRFGSAIVEHVAKARETRR